MKIRRKRTAVLGIIAVALVLFDAWFLSYQTQPQTSWLIRMPDLERAQLKDPVMLVSSHHIDPRIPISSLMDPNIDPSSPSMFRDIWLCKPHSIFVNFSFGEKHEMPVRYYILTPKKSTVASCIAGKLPRGYIIERVNLVPSAMPMSLKKGEQQTPSR